MKTTPDTPGALYKKAKIRASELLPPRGHRRDEEGDSEQPVDEAPQVLQIPIAP